VQVSSIFPSGVWVVGSVRVSQDRVWFAATVIAVALLLGAVNRFTRFGLHTRAVAETETGAYVSGISPDRIAAVNWMISAAVAGLAGILISPIVPLVPLAYGLFIVPALAAAIVGGFQRLGAAVAAGLLIGMLESVTVYVQTRHTWIPSGAPDVVPLLVILVALVVRARPLPSRGAPIRTALGHAPRPERLLAPTVLSVAVAMVALLALHGGWRGAVVTSLIFGVIGLSLVVVTGYAGQVSLAQLTLAGVAGFLLGSLTSDWGVAFPLAPLAAALGATVIGVVVGLPAIRIRGLPVAVVTLSLAVAVEALWFRNTQLVGSGGVDIAAPKLFGIDFSPGTGAAFPRLPFCFLVLGVLVVVALGVARLRTSGLGSAMLAVRANERSAAAAGVDVVRTKIAAFAIGAFIAGLGGSLLAYKQGNVTFDAFSVFLGLTLFATAYLAGITSVSGGILAGVIGAGGLLFYASDQWLSLDPYLYLVLTGVGLVVTVVVNPEGIMGALQARLSTFRTNRLQAEADQSDVVFPDRGAAGPALGAATTARGTAALIRTEATSPDGDVVAALSVQGLTVRYGGVLALDDVSLEVPFGAIVGLIGPNGAGKTTLVDAVTGFAPCSGTVTLVGRALGGLRPHERVRAGLGRTFQSIELWDDLTVDENVRVGLAARRTSLDRDSLDRVFQVLGLDDVRRRPAGELSQGRRKLVSVARALIAEPTVLLLDEPAAGLDSTESQWLGERLREVRDWGVTVVLIDHDMDLVLGLCDDVQVLDFGRLIASGAPDSIRDDRAVAAAYLGTARSRAAVEGNGDGDGVWIERPASSR
jgi:ABC-type branched-subunit amino acid transport system ATPase component/ABC-type branched-subunit amino acid transport system permease subunit